MVVKAVVFDIGGVLIEESGALARDIVAEKHGFDSGDFKDYAKKNLSRSHKGELEAEDFFKGLVDELGLDVSSSVLVEDWLAAREESSKINDVVKEAVDALAGVPSDEGKLKGNYLLGVLSDSTCLNERCSARKNCYGPFDFKILSNEVGSQKPEKKMYGILAKELEGRDVKLEEAVFIDDELENLVPAKELGIKTILFEDAGQMIEDLKLLGVEI